METDRPVSTQTLPPGPTVTVPAIPYLNRQHEAGLVACFAPLFLASFLVVFGTVASSLRTKLADKARSRTSPPAKGRGGKTRHFRPLVLRWQSLVILLGVCMTLIALLELSRHVLPSKSLGASATDAASSQASTISPIRFLRRDPADASSEPSPPAPPPPASQPTTPPLDTLGPTTGTPAIITPADAGAPGDPGPNDIEVKSTSCENSPTLCHPAISLPTTQVQVGYVPLPGLFSGYWLLDMLLASTH